MDDIFNSERLGEGYAHWRPPVHAHVVERIGRRLGQRVGLALDIGCGTGLSTRALHGIAERAVGMEPYVAMLRWSRSVAPEASFIAGRAEEMPVRSHSVPLLAAAGSLNWVDLSRFFPEARRVVKDDGALVIYDFGQGRDVAGSGKLGDWHEEFKRRYPSPPCRTINPETLASDTPGFVLRTAEEFAVPISIAPEFYLEYALTETNVAAAVRNGVPEGEIRRWCEDTLGAVFQGEAQEVTFRGFIAYLHPETETETLLQSSIGRRGTRRVHPEH